MNNLRKIRVRRNLLLMFALMVFFALSIVFINGDITNAYALNEITDSR